MTEQQQAQCASTRALRVVTMEAVTWLERLGLARSLRGGGSGGRNSASDAHGGYGSARTMRAQREVQLALRNNYYISAAPRKYLFIRLPHLGLVSFFRRRRGQ